MTNVLVFGAFDGLHPGHAHFLAEAQLLGGELVVCLATDATIARLKGHAPRHGYAEREAALRLLPVVDRVVPGDDGEGKYSAILDAQPDVIAFGYDQQALHDDCVAWLDRNNLPMHTIVLQSFKPELYKSSLL